tara:strand:- start:7741 stop:8115 length:375 start_codon:yes stop_codon:yes gene_type:complete
MTEEILQAAILRLKASATERFAIIKDLYHRPATSETVDQIVSHSIALAQIEGAAITLQQYSNLLSKQTEAEAESNEPVEPEPEEAPEAEEAENLKHDELMTRSSEYRKSQRSRKKKKPVSKNES